jgi:hypothetical protein
MFNKESCRSCGSTLDTILACTDCKEIVVWNCNNCGSKEEFTHIHNYNDLDRSNQSITIEIKSNGKKF